MKSLDSEFKDLKNKKNIKHAGRKKKTITKSKDVYEPSGLEGLFKLQEGVIAHYQSIIGEKVKEHAQELVDSLIQGALDGDTRIAFELVKTYMPDRVICGIKELKADTMKDVNYAANRILDAKAKGKMDAQLADDLMKNLMDRMNFIMADELEDKIEKINAKK